ncbi:cytochrome P450 [Podospora aff. communis PSN243]|uniref:Cytochrome P450 n=1 Tax=Podospora aff. communis PSN243 TaxID=3040156 RepID=A0AAV9GTF7_9PEZI|nr:cytochrome P450 [Podospora aff. communis PSN243]
MAASFSIAAHLEQLQRLSVKAQIFLVLGLVVFLVTTVQSIVAWYRLRHVPGPFINIWTLWIQVWKIYSEQCPTYYDGLAKKYGPLVRVGPNHVIYSDAETCRRVSAIRSGYTRGPYYEGTRFMPGEDHVGSIVDDKKHAALRKLLAPGYSGLENGGFESSVHNTITRLTDLIERKYLSTPTTLRPFDFASRAMFFALDAASEAAYSEPLGFLSSDSDPWGFLSLVASSMHIFSSIIIIPHLHLLIHAWPLNLLMPSLGDANGFGAIMTAIHSIPNQARRPPLPDRPRPIRMTVLLLITSPPTLRKFLHEIDSAISSGKISSPITYPQALALPYLQATIRESLRLYPPDLILSYRTVPKGGDTVHGYFLPEGTQVGQNARGRHRCRETFGEDADVFRPERWLEEKEERKLGRMNEVVNMVFGHGKFGCLGKPLAMMELNLVFVEWDADDGGWLFRRYEFSLIDPVTPMKLRNATLWLISDFWLKVVPRGS